MRLAHIYIGQWRRLRILRQDGGRREAIVVVQIHRSTAIAGSLTIFQAGEQDLLTSRSHNSSFYVGTSFIGGEDQGYIACP